MSDRHTAADDAMAAEFDTMAEWTADAAVALGPDHHVPAGCRGSGAPSWLDWLIDELGVSAADRVIDVGAGVGGPAAYLAARTGARPVLAEPEAGACRAAARLFDLPVVRAEAAAMPFADARFDVAWCLGVLCTAPDDAAQAAMLRELRRLVGAGGRVGLLVLVADSTELDDPPEGNHFPTTASLHRLLDDARLDVVSAVETGDLAEAPTDWTQRSQAVDRELERRHAHADEWQTAQEQSQRIALLIQKGQVVTRLLHLRVR